MKKILILLTAATLLSCSKNKTTLVIPSTDSIGYKGNYICIVIGKEYVYTPPKWNIFHIDTSYVTLNDDNRTLAAIDCSQSQYNDSTTNGYTSWSTSSILK